MLLCKLQRLEWTNQRKKHRVCPPSPTRFWWKKTRGKHWRLSLEATGAVFGTEAGLGFVHYTSILDLGFAVSFRV